MNKYLVFTPYGKELSIASETRLADKHHYPRHRSDLMKMYDIPKSDLDSQPVGTALLVEKDGRTVAIVRCA